MSHSRILELSEKIMEALAPKFGHVVKLHRGGHVVCEFPLGQDWHLRLWSKHPHEKGHEEPYLLMQQGQGHGDRKTQLRLSEIEEGQRDYTWKLTWPAGGLNKEVYHEFFGGEDFTLVEHASFEELVERLADLVRHLWEAHVAEG